MKLGSRALKRLFHDATWRAYEGERLLPYDQIEPLIGPNSMDVTLHPVLKVPVLPLGVDHVDPRDAASLAWEVIDLRVLGSIIFKPGTFMLGGVQERYVCDDALVISRNGERTAHYFFPKYDGRSSMGRLGILSHITAGSGDYGFGGAFTLEMFNLFPYPVKLYPGMRIGQVLFDEVLEPERYKGAYSGNNHNSGPVEPKLGPGRF